MALIKTMRALAAITVISGAAASYAQQPATPPQPIPEPKLVFDREVYSYASSARRDPFKALVGKESLGPLFDDLKLKGIIFSGDANLSIALIQDGSKRLYRMRRGEVIGNSRVVEIKPLAVRFAVENFGMVKYEVLELRTAGTYAHTAMAQESAAPEKQTAQAQPPEPRVDFPKDNVVRSRQLIDSIAKDRREKTAKQLNKAEEGRTETAR